MAEKKDYKQYRGTTSYRRFKASLTCVITICFMYAVIEAMWGGLGLFLSVDILYFMALYGNIPFGIMTGLATVYAIVNYLKFKKKVDDGSIKDESSFTGYVSGSGYMRGYTGSVSQPTFIPLASDASLSPTEKKVKGLIQMYPKITMEDLAAKAGVPGNQIEEMLLKLISNGNIKGHVDPGTGEFISGMIDTTRVKPVDDAVFDCPHCGAVMKSAPVRGTSVKCESCGNLIVVK
jgi:hypothetical protein